MDLEIPKAVVYHAQPDPSFFSHDLELRKRLYRGKTQLRWLAKREIPAFAVSHFCEIELKRLGFQSVKRLPLLNLDSGLKKATWDKADSEPKQILFVGNILPHKNQAALIDLILLLRWATNPSCQNLIC